MKLNAHGDGYFLINKEDLPEKMGKKRSIRDIVDNQSNLHI